MASPWIGIAPVRSPRERIRTAWPHEAAAISALAWRSKAYWGYAPEEMRVFRGELTLAPERIAVQRTHVTEAWGRLAGFYSLVPVSGTPDVELEHLFVEPAFMGRGVGSRLLAHAAALAARAGHRRMRIQSDPNAVGFYDRYGARRVARVASSLPGRSLPVLEIRIG